jgi:anti-sigma B factor antagonist
MTNDALFDVTESGHSKVPIVNARGEIDVSTSPELHDVLAGVISRRPELVIVNLSEVTFIDSTGLGVLVGTARDLRAKGGELRLVATQPHIIKLLELTGLDEMFDVLPDTKAAVTR